MNKLASILTVSALALGAYVPVHAQEAAEPVATLQLEQGTVMRSEGGEFISANSGARMADGERLMVTENSSAKLTYDTGCMQVYAEAGVYVVSSADCVPGAYAATSTGGVSNSTVATAVAVGFVLVPIIDTLDDDSQDPAPEPPPISQ